jgi:hypothetical protein
MTPLTAVGLGIVFCAVAGVLTRRLSTGTADGLSALGWALAAIGRMNEPPLLVAVVDCALAAYFAYYWWNGRGGDGGRRRRLCTRVRRFLERRRAAPAHT